MGTKTRLEELQEALDSKVKLMDGVTAAIKIEDGENGKGVVVSTEQRDAFRAALADANEIKGLMELERGKAGLVDWAAGVLGGSVAVASGAAAAGNAPPGLWVPGDSKSLGASFLESDAFKAYKDQGYGNMVQGFEVKGVLGSPQRKDVFTDIPTGPDAPPRFGRTQVDAMVPLQQRTARVRDLFPVQQTDANMIEFFRVTGFTNNASVVPERVGSAFGPKPQSGLDFELARAPVQVIAHWEVASRTVLDDEPQLRGVIDNELLYGLRLHEDYQIIRGTGTGSDLLGLLNDPDTQDYPGAYSPPASDNEADYVRRAATKVILSYFEPTGVILHPFDWEDIELEKDANDRYLVSLAVAMGAEKRLWRLNVVDTPAMPQKRFIVGAFGIGVQLYDRMLGQVRLYEQHADLAVRNAVLVLAESRLAMAVKRPESVTLGTLPGSART